MQKTLMALMLCVLSVYGQSFRGSTSTVSDSGQRPSIAIGSDGYPIVAFQKLKPGFSQTWKITIVKCTDVQCDSSRVVTDIDTSGNLTLPSIAIGSDGMPVLSYWDAAKVDIRVAKCGNLSCSSGNTVTIVDSVGYLTGISSIAIGKDGLPIISYRKNPENFLKVAKCGNISCNENNTFTILDSVPNIGGYAQIKIGQDGLPLIGFRDAPSQILMLTKCIDAACKTAKTIIVPNTKSVGDFLSFDVGRDGLPIFAYTGVDSFNLKILKCGSFDCSENNSTATLDEKGNVGVNPYITIPSDDKPMISYWDMTNGVLKLLKCGESKCRSGNVVSIVDPKISGNGAFSSVKTSSDSLPFLTYWDINSDSIQIVKCFTNTCSDAPLQIHFSERFPKRNITFDDLLRFEYLGKHLFDIQGRNQAESKTTPTKTRDR